MKLIKNDTHLDFLGWRRISLAISGTVVVLGVLAYVLMGLNYGIDFRGGTIVQAVVPEDVSIQHLREGLSQTDVGSYALQSFGEEGRNEYLITLAEAEEEAVAGERSPGGKVEDMLKERWPATVIRRVESVGPKVGNELKEAATEAVLLSLVLILAYIWLRFQWRYSLGAIAALFHDVLIVLAAFVVTQREISLTVVAGVLTVAGYSINDTIVIFDRIRESMRRYQRKGMLDIFNESINQTLNRTFITSGTTLFVVLAMFLLGGTIINDFAFALLVGIVVGTYSSIFVASPVVYILAQWFPPKVR